MGTPRVLRVMRAEAGQDVLLAEVPITGRDLLSLNGDVLVVRDPDQNPETVDSGPKPAAKKKSASKKAAKKA